MTRTDVSNPKDQPAPAMGEAGGWGSFDAFRREMDRLLDDFGMAGWPGRGAMRLMSSMPPVPALDMVETAEGYEVTAELPGINPEQIELKVTADALVLKGEKREEKETREKDRHLSERRYGSFQRRLRLPADADTAGITARTEHGVLTIRIPRSTAAAKAEQKITIASA